jgi:hypothetical protein
MVLQPYRPFQPGDHRLRLEHLMKTVTVFSVVTIFGRIAYNQVGWKCWIGMGSLAAWNTRRYDPSNRCEADASTQSAAEAARRCEAANRLCGDFPRATPTL